MKEYKNCSFSEDVHLLYSTCAFETAWHKNLKSPWCSAFDPESLSVIEYAEDLKYYWIDGYGFEITYKQACPAFNDMYEHMVRADKYPSTVVYFTHSGTLLKMIAHMGIHKTSKHLRHDEYDSNVDREWRVSKIDPFGTNLAFVLHQ